MKSKKLRETDLSIEHEPISISVIKIGNKRLPISVYRQIPLLNPLDFYDPNSPKLKGKVIGQIASKVRRSSYSSYHDGSNNPMDVLWVTESGTLAIWPLFNFKHDQFYILQKIPLPNRTNIFNRHDEYCCNLKAALNIFKNIKVIPITEWDKFDQIPKKPEGEKLEYGTYIGGYRCGLNNDVRLELIEKLKRDMKTIQNYEAELEQWAEKAHPLYDEYIKLTIPKIVKLNKLIDKRNKVYQKIISEMSTGHHLFVGS